MPSLSRPLRRARPNHSLLGTHHIAGEASADLCYANARLDRALIGDLRKANRHLRLFYFQKEALKKADQAKPAELLDA
jgi:hypothetical protein